MGGGRKGRHEKYSTRRIILNFITQGRERKSIRSGGGEGDQIQGGEPFLKLVHNKVGHLQGEGKFQGELIWGRKGGILP